MKQDSSTGYPALLNAAGLANRTNQGRILVTGADRRAYLQGLLTNDIEALTPGTGCYAAMLNAQGRMLTDLRVLELGDAILIDVPVEVTPAIRDHLDRFVFSEDVQVDDVTAARAEVGIYGPHALAVLQRAGIEGAASLPPYGNARGRLAGVDAVVVRSDEFGVDGFDVIVDASHRDTATEALLAAGAVSVSDHDLETVRIENGRPRFGVDMDADTIPLEAGIEDRAISRSKGCYVGQEVIVRVQDRGHGRVARRLVGLTLPPDAQVPARGAKIRVGEKDIGRVTSAAWSPSLDRPVALGYVHRDFAAPETRVSVDGAEAIVAVPPFGR